MDRFAFTEHGQKDIGLIEHECWIMQPIIPQGREKEQRAISDMMVPGQAIVCLAFAVMIPLHLFTPHHFREPA
jgi:hypothetical protein